MKSIDNKKELLYNDADIRAQEIVDNYVKRCLIWERNIKRALIIAKAIVVLIIVGVSYLFTPDLECQYVIGHNAHKPAMVCEQLNNTLEQCINFA